MILYSNFFNLDGNCGDGFGCDMTQEAADLYAALLDELKIDQVIVYGISGGGPSAINFALKHLGYWPLIFSVETACKTFSDTT